VSRHTISASGLHSQQLGNNPPDLIWTLALYSHWCWFSHVLGVQQLSVDLSTISVSKHTTSAAALHSQQLGNTPPNLIW